MSIIQIENKKLKESLNKMLMENTKLSASVKDTKKKLEIEKVFTIFIILYYI